MSCEWAFGESISFWNEANHKVIQIICKADTCLVFLAFHPSVHADIIQKPDDTKTNIWAMWCDATCAIVARMLSFLATSWALMSMFCFDLVVELAGTRGYTCSLDTRETLFCFVYGSFYSNIDQLLLMRVTRGGALLERPLSRREYIPQICRAWFLYPWGRCPKESRVNAAMSVCNIRL